ncbi:hypothetical protein UPYG_G00256760 [Umbra pygmaea]|uniref:Uncharacterized protein n=1 Tax=Umbra pygmaea TaxID=75934 RepID=A0ABD0WVR5_UMBPY
MILRPFEEQGFSARPSLQPKMAATRHPKMASTTHPKMAGTPQRKMAGTPQLPEMAAAPQLPEMAAAPQLPEMAAAPQIPEMAAAPQLPEMAASPQLPEMAAFPELAEMAASPQNSSLASFCLVSFGGPGCLFYNAAGPSALDSFAEGIPHLNSVIELSALPTEHTFSFSKELETTYTRESGMLELKMKGFADSTKFWEDLNMMKQIFWFRKTPI